MEATRSPAARLTAAVRGAGAARLLMLAAGVVGGALVMAAELSTIVKVDVLTAGTCEEIADPDLRDACDLSGFEQHGGAFLLLGALAIAMAVGVARAQSRPAALALVALGAIVLAFTVVRDLPKADETGRVGLQFDEAEAKPGTGLYLEVIGGGLCVLAGLRGLRRRERS